MGDAENAFTSSKKRVAGVQLSRDNPGLDDDEDTNEQETGTFKKASDEVLARRRIVKVRRQAASTTPSAPSSNPFAGIRLVPPSNISPTSAEATTAAVKGTNADSKEAKEKNGSDVETVKDIDANVEKAESKVDEAVTESTAVTEKTETNKDGDEYDKKLEGKVDEPRTESPVDKENTEIIGEAAKSELADAKTLDGEKATEAKTDADKNRNENEAKEDGDDLNVQKEGEASPFSSFQQLSSSQNAFTGLVGSGFSSSTFSFGSISTDGSRLGSGIFGSDGLKNGNSSLFSNAGTSIANKSEGSGIPAMQEVTVETGEENEKAVFTADSVLFEFIDGGWKERGKGEIKVNVSTSDATKARLVMRARGNYRLILNASLYSDMKLTPMEKKGITFSCVNSNGEGKEGLSPFAVKFKDASIAEEFREIVMLHKGKIATGLKTPENSP